VRSPLADALIKVARSYLAVRELEPNRGREIDRWNEEVGAELGSAYQCSFVSHCIERACVALERPRPVMRYASTFHFWSEAKACRMVKPASEAIPGDLGVILQGKTWRHVGVVVQGASEGFLRLIEANVGSDRPGDRRGVHEKRRACSELAGVIRLPGIS